ncbi:protein-disulfide reductase DsbD [Guyparkeria halophila]|uniref:Thiol:disulfide interchange protein DsbD n=1 Tax=Guyparkeria halophila TaxID=47960 RepID=A0A6I6CTY1_9GAMM|nr:protein-disulfide reductase DsbD [Guyparkeria halophila]QGT77916.1 protein-disulfide reductase DsbD [Guyparkeria halophila]
MRSNHSVTAPWVRIATFLLAAVALAWQPAVTAQPELLGPEEAFGVEASHDDGELKLDFRVVEGYHLYQDKLSIRGDDSVELGEPQLPEAVIDDDPVFGETPVYKEDFTARVPIDSAPGGEATITVEYQGCSDIHGVCYPPETHELSVDLPRIGADMAAEQAPASGADSRDGGISLGGFGGASNEPMDPEEAFVPEVIVDGESVFVRFDVAPEYYLYRDRTKAAVAGDASIRAAHIGEGERKDDPNFGTVWVFHDQLETELAIDADSPYTLVVGYQGCADMGLCYPPMEKAWRIDPAAGEAERLDEVPDDAGELTPLEDMPALGDERGEAPAGTDTSGGTSADTATEAATPAGSETDMITQRLIEGTPWAIVLGFLIFGLLLAFTPCVFPMIPILSGIIAGQGEHITTRKAFVLSLVYVLAMAVTYTVAGVLAGLFGANLQAAFQNPWVLSVFAAIFVALAFSMFGFFELQLPSSIQSRIMQAQNRQQGGTLTGVAVMGFLSALIVGPCMAPPLAGALIYIGQTGDAVIGGMALFALSIGMGLPLILVGTLGGKYLPKAGGWMDAVKAVFGVLLLGVAIWMLERFLPAAITQLMWAVLLIASAVYMGATESLREAASGWLRLWKSLGLVLLLWGALMLIGIAAGAKGTPFAPLSGISLGGGGGEVAELEFRLVDNEAELDEALEQAKNAGQPVMLDFYADWCISCKEMEHNTFSDPRVIEALSGFLVLQADVTANNADHKALLKRFDLYGPPGIIFWDAEGERVRQHWVVGYQPPDEFLGHVTAVSNR